MADTVTTKLNSPSPEQVAFELFKLIAAAEGRGFDAGYTGAATRGYILSPYAQCRAVVISGWKATDALSDRPVVE